MINSFSGEHRWLSNFWPAEVIYAGERYPTVEHAYVAAKTLNPIQRVSVLECETPGEAKRLGRSFDLRPCWDDIKKDIMRNLLIQKFMNNTEFADKLLATGDQPIIEGNVWGDTYWGVCEGEGSNILGKLIMEIRQMLTDNLRVGILHIERKHLADLNWFMSTSELFNNINFKLDEVIDESSSVIKFRGVSPHFIQVIDPDMRIPQYWIKTSTSNGKISNTMYPVDHAYKYIPGV